MRKFDAATWEKDKTQRVVTRSGFRDVKLFAVIDGRVFGAMRDKDSNYPEWEAESWDGDGSYMGNGEESGLDLMFADPFDPSEEEIAAFLIASNEGDTCGWRTQSLDRVAKYAISRIRELEVRA